MNSVFNGYGIYKPIHAVWEFIKDIPFLIRCCHQRIHKGYCVKDTWSIDYWFISTLKPMLEDLKNDHHGFPAFLEYDYWEEHKDEIGMSYEQWMSWSKDENKNRLKAAADKICDQKWNEILERMIFLLNEMDEDTCSRQNPYKEEWYSYHERFRKKYPKNGDELKSKEELTEEKKSGSTRMVTPSKDPEFGKEYDEISEKMMNEDRKLEKYREDCKDEFMGMFSKYFHNLWD